MSHFVELPTVCLIVLLLSVQGKYIEYQGDAEKNNVYIYIFFWPMPSDLQKRSVFEGTEISLCW